MLKTMGWKTALCIGCLALAGAYGCGDDSSGGGSSNNGGSNNNNSNASESSFSATVETEDGTEQHTNQQDDSKAGQGTWGASIAGSKLHITLSTQEGTVISGVVTTTEAMKAPGDFTPGTTDMDTFFTVVDAVQGSSYSTNGTGTITLDTCPRAIGEHAKGSFNGVELASDTGNASRTIDGSFDVVVYAKAGDLFCNEQSSSNNNTNPNNSNNNTQQCSADWCEDGGTCCPYMECMNQCEFECFTGAECQGGLNPQACATCSSACFDECDVSQECRSAAVDLNTCSENNACGETEDEAAEQACLESNCCSEVNAAL